MEPLPPKSPPSPEMPPRRRGRKPGKPLTPRELATRRANLERARAALLEGYPPTEKRLRASRANLAKAQAARRTPQGDAAARLNALKHGLFAKDTLVESVDRLGEDKKAFARHVRFIERVFAPADAEEKPIVRGLAETLWRRLRFFHAQVTWEKERLERAFKHARAADPSNVDDTVARADTLTIALMSFEAFYRELDKIESQIEFWLRQLIRKRSHGQIDWKGFSPRRDPVMEMIEKFDSWDRFADRFEALSPAQQAAFWDGVLKPLGAKPAGPNPSPKVRR